MHNTNYYYRWGFAPYFNTSSMSDEEGNLLFYTTNRIYTRKHRLMPGLQETDSMTYVYQSLTIPVPGSRRLFYVFSLYGRSSSTRNKLDYTVVDMSRNEGYGEAIEKRTILQGYPTPGFTIIRHSDSECFWFLYYDSEDEVFKARKVTSSGIDEHVVNSNFPFTPPGHWDIEARINYKVSPDQKKIAVLVSPEPSFAQLIYLFDFNAETGGMENGRMLSGIDERAQAVYDAEFSPDSKLLYYSTDSSLYQAKISSSDNSGMQATQVKTCSSSISLGLQLAQNGKIYINEHSGSGTKLGVIHAPNQEGVLCNIVFEEINAQFGIFSFPKFVSAYLQPAFSFQNTCLGEETTFKLIDTTVVSADWDFGDQGSETVNSLNPTYAFTTAGDHYVRCTLQYANGESKTYGSNVRIRGPLASNINDTTLCAGDTFRFQPCAPEVYHSSSGSVDYHEIIANDTVIYETSNGCYEGYKAIAVNFQKRHTVELGGDTIICFDQLPYPVELPVLPEASYVWSNGDTINQTSFLEGGHHHANVTLGACSVSDSIVLEVTPALPVATLGADTSLCIGDTLMLDVFQEGARFLWQDGSTEPFYNTSTSEQVKVDIFLGGCNASDSLTVTFYDAPEVDLGADTAICHGDTLWLDVYNTEAGYLWQDLSDAHKLPATETGLYSVHVNRGYCTRSDSTFVTIVDPPYQPEQRRFVICEGAFHEVDLSQENVSFLWSDGSTEAWFTTDKAESFYVFRENMCGTALDTFEVFLELMPELQILGAQEACTGDTVFLKTEGNIDVVWDDGSSDSIRAIVHSGKYFAEGSNACGGLRATHEVTINDCCEAGVIPNLITPNGDQRNDYFYFECAKQGGWEINIYNRHGKLVFSDSNYDNNWNGKGLSDGVYYYELKRGNISYKGWVHLIR
ncbi:gliding motility-associated C-terminal domain-containing protein [Cytophagaceae bacterium ABcell3]|nr:gliding motility-associated C-terminal domain-containing protein [Cytophagaceae bacterium ABcell3]